MKRFRCPARRRRMYRGAISSGVTRVCACLVLIFLLGPANAAGAADEPAAAQEFVFKSSTGATFKVTKAGLSSIELGGRRIASGHWTVFNAEQWFKGEGAGEAQTGPHAEETLTVVSERQVRVRHVAPHITCETDYTFDGEDVIISARVENRHLTAPLNVPGFSGLTFDFDRPPSGFMQLQHISYFQTYGTGLCHPSHWSPIGGSYAVDDAVGVGLSPWNTGLTRTLLLWDYADWAEDKRDKLPQRNLIYFVVQSVPPRGAATFDLRLRVSPDLVWKHLLEPYREHFQKTYGEVRYKADFRWIATDYLNRDAKAISRSNPYGFHGDFRRFDLPEGMKKFCNSVLPTVKRGGAQGVLLWGQGGENPRGEMYRSDFDILPPEVEANWPKLDQACRDEKLRLGVCTRPKQLMIRATWQGDASVDINPDDPNHCEMLWRRFENMRKRGCSCFYLDSFGDCLEDVKLMRFLRAKLGPDVLTFAEHQCDAMLPLSGGYSETDFIAGEGGQRPRYQLRSDLGRWKIYQWLAPGAQMVSRLYNVQGKIPSGMEPIEQFFFRHGITPLLSANDLGRALEVRHVQATFLDANGQWK